MKILRSTLFWTVATVGFFGLAHAADDDSATNPRDFNSFYAPAYQLPDPVTLSSSAASGKELQIPGGRIQYGPFQPIEAALKAARNARGFP